MTREEHIEQLKKLRSFHNGSYGRSINKAIKALEQEPSTDAVSRQAVKEQMIKYGFYAPDMTVTEFVEELPPVTPTRPKGQWLEYNYPSNEYVYCSNCKEKFDTEYLYLGESEYPNYCPHCGADMREGEV